MEKIKIKISNTDIIKSLMTDDFFTTVDLVITEEELEILSKILLRNHCHYQVCLNENNS